jgi:hypothetical protein
VDRTAAPVVQLVAPGWARALEGLRQVAELSGQEPALTVLGLCPQMGATAFGGPLLRRVAGAGELMVGRSAAPAAVLVAEPSVAVERVPGLFAGVPVRSVPPDPPRCTACRGAPGTGGSPCPARRRPAWRSPRCRPRLSGPDGTPPAPRLVRATPPGSHVCRSPHGRSPTGRDRTPAPVVSGTCRPAAGCVVEPRGGRTASQGDRGMRTSATGLRCASGGGSRPLWTQQVPLRPHEVCGLCTLVL